MPTSVYNKFNRGEIDPLVLAREDIEKVKNSCQLMNNFIPIRLGAMMFRPGTEYIGDIDSKHFLIPFISSLNSKAILEFTNNKLRIWSGDQLISRSSVTTVISDNDFTGSPSPWTDSSSPGASATTTVSGGVLVGTGIGSGVLFQTTTSIQANTEHTVNITIEKSPMTIEIGESGNGSSEFFSGQLLPGNHSLVFTSNNSEITFTLSNKEEYESKITNLSFALDGVQEFVTEIDSLSIDSITFAQSADIVYIAYSSGKPIQIEKRGDLSWSIVYSRFDSPPFEPINITSNTLQTTTETINPTLKSSKTGFFNAGSVGEIYRITNKFQSVEHAVYEGGYETDSIKIFGVGTARDFTTRITGSAGGTIQLQRSDDEVVWSTVSSFTSDHVTTVFSDGLDNQVLYYRLRIKINSFNPTVDFITLELSSIDSIAGEGVVRVVEYVDGENVIIQYLKPYKSRTFTGETPSWSVSSWNEKKGYPTSVSLHEGRLWYASGIKLWGSVSDNYNDFDIEVVGDSASISKTIGFGSTDGVNWISSTATQLVLGLSTGEVSVKSSSFGEALSQSNINLKTGSSQGSAKVSPVIIDGETFFLQRSERKIMQSQYLIGSDSQKTVDLMSLNQDICLSGVVRFAVARQPETRIFVVLNNGEVRVCLLDDSEDVRAWSRMTTSSGFIRDVIILPSIGEDEIYFSVQRGGNYYLEKMARFEDFKDKHFDSFSHHTDGSSIITGLERFGVNSVGVWGDGEYKGSFAVSSGSITIEGGLDNVYLGYEYTADYISNKLGQYAPYSILNKRARIYSLGLIARDIYPRNGLSGLSIGNDLNNLQAMPLIEGGIQIDANLPVDEYDYDSFEFNGVSDTDSRVSMRATDPIIIMALTYGIKDTESKSNKKKRPE